MFSINFQSGQWSREQFSSIDVFQEHEQAFVILRKGKKTNHMSRRIVISARDARSQWTTKNVFVDVLLPAYFFDRSFHGLCLKRAEQVDDERVFNHGHDLFFCLHMFHLWAKTKASSTMKLSCEAHECSLRNFLRTVTPQFWNVGFLAQSM